MDETEEFIREICSGINYLELERELGLPKDWIITVAGEDDWSFIIKAHALLEAAANQAIENQLNKNELSEVIARLEFSGTKTGKVHILNKLGILNSDCKRFCSKLSEIRNSFVHNIKNVELDLDDFIENLSDSEKKGIQKAFCWNIPNWQGYNWNQITNKDSQLFFSLAASSWDKSKKMAIWFGILYLLKKLNDSTIIQDSA
jgi:hypothetical protein